ncbi:uncharacterized protein P174DRAFT_432787 [Aspergillus novofumigatus IBT 16806]|uniref:Ankyrin repeat protein n=1 Tax=Aspergillus novofumigatus (strain IBT 16806) TaxID=1392255 RepID=A0A2I1C110_ASPN1|nr:uncharacterized protein P174DRAFT_432787 [Aspergillus novofumigatus IBT 16806]PKX91322.1 hypothetical protein P174DRAFT_432787 [Aspergillus novofumigatus IBT 16806]
MIGGETPTSSIALYLAYWSNITHPGTLKSAIDDLLAAVADQGVCDPRGNTALHYLALRCLDDFGVRGEEERHLCRLLQDRGIDPNARNMDGQSAFELYTTAFDTDRYRNRQEKWYTFDAWMDMDEPYAKIDKEDLGMFEKAGADETRRARHCCICWWRNGR